MDLQEGVIERARKAAILGAIVVLLLAVGGCGRIWNLIPRAAITSADLSGATALAIVKSAVATTERAVEGDESPYDQLYKQLTGGSWVPVEFSNTRGRTAELPLSLLLLERLNARFFLMVFGTRQDPSETEPGMDPWEDWTDTFLLDADDGNMYYLNQVANPTADDGVSSRFDPDKDFGTDDAGRVYYIAGTFSNDNFANEWLEVRDTTDIVRLTADPASSNLTAEFITPEATWEYEMSVNGSGDVVYAFSTDFMGAGTGTTAFQTATGVVGFVDDYIDTSRINWTSAGTFFHGKDREIYYVSSETVVDPVDPMSQSTVVFLGRLGFPAGVPVTTETWTLLTDPMAAMNAVRKVNIEDQQLLLVASGWAASFDYVSPPVLIDFPVDISPQEMVTKSERYVYILNGSDPAMGVSETTVALLVDLVNRTAIVYPIDKSRYRVDEFRDYPADPDAAFAKLTDVLTGTTSSYALHPDGSMELLSEETEETLIVTIEPL